MTTANFADFLRGENLIFLLIVLAVFVSFLWAILIIILKIIKAIKRTITRRSAIKEKINPSEIKVEQKQEAPVLPKTRIMGGDFVKISKKSSGPEVVEKKTKKDYSSGLSGLKNRKAEPESTNVMKEGVLKSGRISLKK